MTRLAIPTEAMAALAGHGLVLQVLRYLLQGGDEVLRDDAVLETSSRGKRTDPTYGSPAIGRRFFFFHQNWQIPAALLKDRSVPRGLHNPHGPIEIHILCR